MAQQTAYIGLGSNLGDRKAYIDKAVKILAQTEKIKVSKISDIIETDPLGRTDQPKYLNAVAKIKTSYSAEDLHSKLIDIENSLERTRDVKWSPRTIDLDLLLFGTETINSPNLIVPHPQMHLRSFVLKGLCRLNPHLEHPVLKESVSRLADRLNGADFAIDPAAPQLVSIAGIIGVGKTTLTKKLSKPLHCQQLLEPYDENPFLPQVYAGKKQLALDSQLFFLTARAEQLNPDCLKTGRLAVSDYIFNKELIYANRLLDSRQLTLYQDIYLPFSSKVAQPVLVIYLRDSAESCLERIHQRSRPYEQKIELDFLHKLESDYDSLFANWRASPVIRILMSEPDCTKNENIEHLANQIKSYTAVK